MKLYRHRCNFWYGSAYGTPIVELVVNRSCYEDLLIRSLFTITCEFDELSKPRRDLEELWRHNRVIIVGSEFLVATLRNHEDLVVTLRKHLTIKLFEVKFYMLLCYLCYFCMFSHVRHCYVCLSTCSWFF